MINQITERVFYMEGSDETDCPCLYYVKGDHQSLAIDGGISPLHVKQFYEELKEANLPLPDYTAITHWHWDHTYGMSAVAGTTVATKLTNLKLREMAEWPWNLASMEERVNEGLEIKACHDCILAEYPDLDQIKVEEARWQITDTQVLDLGGVTCHLIPIVTPHTKDSMVIYVPEEKVLALGDGLAEDYYDGNGIYDKERVKDIMEFMEETDFQLGLLGHSGPRPKAIIMRLMRAVLSR